MRKLIFAIFASFIMPLVAQNPITVNSKEFSNNPEIEGILGVLGANQTTATIFADSIEAKYYAIWMIVCNDEETYRQHVTDVPVRPDSTQIVITCMPKDSTAVAVYVNGPGFNHIVNLHTSNHLLVGCKFGWTFNESDTIPLMAYTSGIVMRARINGKIVEGEDICGLRYSKVHPSQWKSKFNIPRYIYFEAIPVKEPTDDE